ncbi:2Fe-2S iron-sulfur cluster binding domain-containing protein [Prescottella sp. R16]|uniref:2Fe-2S iron-sulfur cluster-binding protein n=1 Tax=Prescottella sp. R16 TaxID=3064529 RepID=UPI00272DEEB6|nr:2Fe-2S iron-sulfur cluster binding domain-containing protein [Prescottella sp. R16]
MDSTADGVRAAGVPVEHFHQEAFISITGDLFEAPRPIVDDDPDPAVETVVHPDGESHRFEWPSDNTLVEVLLDRGVDVPFSCRSGEYGSCACTVVSGKVLMEKSGILGPSDIAGGHALGCQARPDSGPIEIELRRRSLDGPACIDAAKANGYSDPHHGKQWLKLFSSKIFRESFVALRCLGTAALSSPVQRPCT